MKLISTLLVLVTFALVSVNALLADGSKIEANHGEDVTLSFTMDKAEKAGRLRITFTSETTKKSFLIAQRCAGSESCDAVETPGVTLRIEKVCASLSIQKVNSSRSGLYKAQTFFGKDVFERNVSLVVTQASFSSSSAPPHTSIPKPFDSSNLQGLYVLIPVVIVILLVVCFWKCRRILCSQKKELESNSSDCLAVSINGHRENPEALLTDT